ncbi:hypothetical protein [Rhodococcus sp. Q]|uniref:hypothetical protein n=1 Tax=Rhodococcus sp. Q TaxID=2502252 RepID=UPI0010F80C7C|nr:hypothetical protein [Rhodococcus sp. Q]
MRSIAKLALSAAIVAIAGTTVTGNASAQDPGGQTELTSFNLEICTDQAAGTDLSRLQYSAGGVLQQSPYEGRLDVNSFVQNGELACTHILFEADTSGVGARGCPSCPEFHIWAAALNYSGASRISLKLTKTVETESIPFDFLGSLGGEVAQAEVTVFERTAVGRAIDAPYLPGPYLWFQIHNGEVTTGPSYPVS